MDKNKLVNENLEISSTKNNPQAEEDPLIHDRPPKAPNKSTWSYYPSGGRTLFGSFQRVRVEGRRGRGYWEWKAAELKNKNVIDGEDVTDEEEPSFESKRKPKGHVTFLEPEERCDVINPSSPGRLDTFSSGMGISPPSTLLQERMNRIALSDESGEEENAVPIERVTVSSFSQPRLTPLVEQPNPLKEPSSMTPSPPSGTAPTAPPKEFLYADAELRRATRSQPSVGHEHQSLDCKEWSKNPSDRPIISKPPDVVQGLTKAQVYSEYRNPEIDLNDDRYRQYYLNRAKVENNSDIQNPGFQSKQSTYTDHSESSLNSSHTDNTLSSIASLSSSNKNDFQPGPKPIVLQSPTEGEKEDKEEEYKSYNPKQTATEEENIYSEKASTLAPLRQKDNSTNIKRHPSSDAARRSGALVWVTQPGGGNKLEWIPTPGLVTLRAVPASPEFSNIKIKISSQPQKRGVASAMSAPPKGIMKRGDEGGGGGTRDARARDDSLARVASNDPRVGANGGAQDSGAQGSPSLSETQSKNVLSSAPGNNRSAGRTLSAPTGTGSLPEEGDKIVTVAGKGHGQTVRIRVRPEVHAYLSTLPVINSSSRGLEPPFATTDRRDSIHSANSSSGSGLTLGSGEGSLGYQEQGYDEVVDEYMLLKKAIDEHDPEAIRLLTATEAVYHTDSGSSEYPYLREMKERLLISKDTPITMLDACRQEQDTNQLLEVHQSPVGTVVKLNPDGYGSHTTPTHRVESLYTGTLESRRTHAHEFFPKNAKLHDVKLVLSFFLLGALSTSKALLLFPKRLKIWSSKSSPSYSEEISDFLLKIIYYIM